VVILSPTQRSSTRGVTGNERRRALVVTDETDGEPIGGLMVVYGKMKEKCRNAISSAPLLEKYYKH